VTTTTGLAAAIREVGAIRAREAAALGGAWWRETPQRHETRELAAYLWRMERAISDLAIRLAPTPAVRGVARASALLAPIWWAMSFALLWRPGGADHRRELRRRWRRLEDARREMTLNTLHWRRLEKAALADSRRRVDEAFGAVGIVRVGPDSLELRQSAN
jgi:hypothetical protein